MRVTWLQLDGQLDLTAIHQDEQTGCVLWNRSVSPNELGPMAMVPRTYPLQQSERSPYVRHPVREILWELQHEPVTPGFVVIASCGNRACVAPEHGLLRRRYPGLTDEQRSSLQARKDHEGVRDAAARLGINRNSVRGIRGPGGKRTAPATPLRTWLAQQLPAEEVDKEGADLDATLARRFAAGQTYARLASDFSLTPAAVGGRVRRWAKALRFPG